jgi:hypothetical protein
MTLRRLSRVNIEAITEHATPFPSEGRLRYIFHIPI